MVAIPCLIVAVLVIIALPDSDRYGTDDYDDEIVLDARKDPQLVSNSNIGFFYKNEQLYEYRKQRKPDKTKVIKMVDSVVTTDFTKNDLSIVPDTEKGYTGPTDIVISNGVTYEYVEKTENGFVLKGGDKVAKEDSFEVVLDTGIWGSNPTLPHRIKKLDKYYTAFTGELQTIYFEFTTENEFACIRVGDISGNIQYTLLDSEQKELKNGCSGEDKVIDIQWKARAAGTYYLKLTGSFSDSIAPFYVELPADDNEWLWQMKYVSIGQVASGNFEYYGDQDFFVLPPAVIANADKAAITFSQNPVDINIVVYDKEKNILAQYLQKKNSVLPVSLYALDGAYAIGVYSYEGAASGSEYKFSFGIVDMEILDIQTYGFKLSPGYSDKEDYYTASIESLEGKKITDIMTTVPTNALSITVEQQCGYTSQGYEGEELKLGPGRNVITITLSTAEKTREITIVVSNRADEVYYGYKTNGSKVFIVDDSLDDGMIMIQNSDGKYEKLKASSLYTYVKTEMPESYRAKIEALQKAHPNWKFTFVKTGFDFNEYIDTQDRLEGSTPVSTVEGKRASRAQIEYYVDPRNFLDEKNVFMFEKQTYVEGIYSKTGLGSIWSEKPEAVLPESTYISYFEEAGESAGISPYFIIARSSLESGHGTSKFALGTVSGYEGYYNFYGINADNAQPTRAAKFAKEHNWNTRRRAIIEGAAWIKNQYIGCMQYSAYFMKYCFVKSRTWHQYMTDIMAPSRDAQNYYKAHKNGGTLDSQIEFVIPVFDNMP